MRRVGPLALTIIATLAVVSSPVEGQRTGATMRGMIVSGPDSIPVAEASVFIRLERRGSISDGEGRFLIEGVEGAKVVLEIQDPCHHSTLREVVMDGGDVEVPVIVLNPTGRCEPSVAPMFRFPQRAAAG